MLDLAFKMMIFCAVSLRSSGECVSEFDGSVDDGGAPKLSSQKIYQAPACITTSSEDLRTPHHNFYLQVACGASPEVRKILNFALKFDGFPP